MMEPAAFEESRELDLPDVGRRQPGHPAHHPRSLGEADDQPLDRLRQPHLDRLRVDPSPDALHLGDQPVRTLPQADDLEAAELVDVDAVALALPLERRVAAAGR